VTRSVIVFRGMLVFRIVATADVAAGHAEPQVNPGIPHFQAFLAAVRRAGFYIFDLIEMRAGCVWHGV